jgi:hypothetical protein
MWDAVYKALEPLPQPYNITKTQPFPHFFKKSTPNCKVWYKCTDNLILKDILYHFPTCDKLVMLQEQPQQTNTPQNTLPMVVKPFTPPVTSI